MLPPPSWISSASSLSRSGENFSPGHSGASARSEGLLRGQTGCCGRHSHTWGTITAGVRPGTHTHTHVFTHKHTLYRFFSLCSPDSSTHPGESLVRSCVYSVLITEGRRGERRRGRRRWCGGGWGGWVGGCVLGSFDCEGFLQCS